MPLPAISRILFSLIASTPFGDGPAIVKPDAPVATSAGTRISSAQAMACLTPAIASALPQSSATSDDDRNSQDR